MSEMIERVARAIKGVANDWADGEGCDELLDWDDDYCRTLARAAIEAHKAALAEAGFVIVPREPTKRDARRRLA